MAKHALLSPSSAHRWLECPGSVALSMGRPDTSSEAADEGTAAHELAADCLKSGANTSQHLGRVIKAGEREFTVDSDMAEFVQTYVDNIRLYAKDSHSLMVEQALPVGKITGEKDAQGTSDAIIFMDDELQVHDLKYGRGNEASAIGNPQLKLYALAALYEYEPLHDFKRVRLVIHQPRINTAPSEWDCSVEELKAWSISVRAAASLALFLVREPGGIAEWLNPGEKQCQWCKAKADCPALREFVKEEVGADFDMIKGLPPTGWRIPNQHTILSNSMRAVDLVEGWCKAVRAEVERLLLQGEPVDGFKLVQGRKGSRAW